MVGLPSFMKMNAIFDWCVYCRSSAVAMSDLMPPALSMRCEMFVSIVDLSAGRCFDG